MNRFKVLTLVLTLFLIISPFASQSADAAVGDIIITNSTSYNGITGHMGIYVENGMILHTSGWDSEPFPRLISSTNWHKRYPQSKVVRSESLARGNLAATMARKYFEDKKIPYFVTPGVWDLTNTYCSELVWYAYAKAGSQYVTRSVGVAPNISWTAPSVIKPYDYTNDRLLRLNGYKYIDGTW